MSNLFRTLRACLLGSVVVWTLIVLGIAIHFQMSFVDSASELTFVSLSVFAAAVTLALFLLLLVAPCNKKLAVILRTKWELAWLGVLSILWLSLAGYTTTPRAKETEIECWDEDDETGAVIAENVEGYSNDVYHARYRALQAFSFFNAILLLLLFLFILLLALWHHKRGRYVIWTTPTTAVGWFDRGTYAHHIRRLPFPITQRKSDKDEDFLDLKGGKYNKYGSPKGKLDDDDEEALWEKPKAKQQEMVQKPPAVARHNTAPVPNKPRQYVVNVPLTEAVKPPLAPIAAKMSAKREERPQPVRSPSQRELFDAARQQARRERGSDEELVRKGSRRNRDAAKDNDKPSDVPVVYTSRPTNVTRETSNASKPAVTRPDPRRAETQPNVTTNTRPSAARNTPAVRTQPTQPAVVRSGSGGGAARDRDRQPRDRERSQPADVPQPTPARRPSLPRTPGRRI